MNDIGKTYFLLRGAQLSERQHFDLRLRVDGYLSRYNDIRRLCTRMFGDHDAAKSSTLHDMAGVYHGSSWQDT
eukprot:1827397-Pyramimonas_sp.AAC.1